MACNSSSRSRKKRVYEDFLTDTSSFEFNEEDFERIFRTKKKSNKKKGSTNKKGQGVKRASKKKTSTKVLETSTTEKPSTSTTKKTSKKRITKSKEEKEKRRKEIEELIVKRSSRLEERIKKLEKDEMESLLKEMVSYQPALLMSLLEKGDPTQGYHPEPSPGKFPDWCKCTHCREMPTEAERKCCKYIPANCLSQVPDIEILVLESGVLRLARNYRNDVYAMPLEEEEDENRAMRHAAYRQFILWTVGKLGKGDRRVIPSCCVWRIRDKFRDPFNQYKGFIPSNRL